MTWHDLEQLVPGRIEGRPLDLLFAGFLTLEGWATYHAPAGRGHWTFHSSDDRLKTLGRPLAWREIRRIVQLPPAPLPAQSCERPLWCDCRDDCRRSVERRVIRAIRTLDALPGGASLKSEAWPVAFIKMADNNEEDDKLSALNRFYPTRQDIAEYEQALAWFAALQKYSALGWQLCPEQRLVVWRAYELSFRQIGDRIGQYHTTAQRRYRRVIGDLAVTANKPTVHGCSAPLARASTGAMQCTGPRLRP